MIATQNDVEKVLQVDYTDTPDARITAALSVAQALHEAESDMLYDQPGAAITNYLTGDGTEDLWTPRWPISAAPTVTEDGTALTIGTHYEWWPNGRLLRIGSIRPTVWSMTPKAVAVTYLPGWADETEAPQQLRWSVAQCAARFWQQGFGFAKLSADDSGIMGVKQETIGGYTVTYRDGLGQGVHLLPEEVVIAQRFRRRAKAVST